MIRHPMETGFRVSDETGKLIPEHYIKKILVKHNNNVIFSCDWSRAVSKNPYLTFSYAGSKGDKLEILWVDNKGNKDSNNITIK